MLRLQVFNFTQLATKELGFKLYLYNPTLSFYDSMLSVTVPKRYKLLGGVITGVSFDKINYTGF